MRRTSVVCPGCRKLHRSAGTTYCPACAASRDVWRGTTSQRGYGAAHQRERARYIAMQRRGVALTCARCGQPIKAGDAWDLGHTDDRTAWLGPEHAAACNRAAAGRASHRFAE